MSAGAIYCCVMAFRLFMAPSKKKVCCLVCFLSLKSQPKTSIQSHNVDDVNNLEASFYESHSNKEITEVKTVFIPESLS